MNTRKLRSGIPKMNPPTCKIYKWRIRYRRLSDYNRYFLIDFINNDLKWVNISKISARMFKEYDCQLCPFIWNEYDVFKDFMIRCNKYDEYLESERKKYHQNILK